MATREIACILLTAALVAAACSERAKPEAAAPSASAAQPAAAPTERKAVDVPAGRPPAAGDLADPTGAGDPDQGVGDPDQEQPSPGAEIVQQTITPKGDADIEPAEPVEPGPGATADRGTPPRAAAGDRGPCAGSCAARSSRRSS